MLLRTYLCLLLHWQQHIAIQQNIVDVWFGHMKHFSCPISGRGQSVLCSWPQKPLMARIIWWIKSLGSLWIWHWLFFWRSLVKRKKSWNLKHWFPFHRLELVKRCWSTLRCTEDWGIEDTRSVGWGCWIQAWMRVRDEKGPGWWLLRHTLIQWFNTSGVQSLASSASLQQRVGFSQQSWGPFYLRFYKLGTLLRDQLSFTNLQLTPFLHIPTTKICGTRHFGSVRKDSCFSRQPRLKIKKAPV